jgi:transcription elongation GreA/GreB family factor
MGRAMIGKAVGDLFVVQTPAGEREFVVEGISFE